MADGAVPAAGGLQDVAHRLYALLPDEFTAERGAEVRRARAAGDRPLADAVGRLRKPSTAAWLVNAFVRRRRDEVDQLLALGEQLRQAQSALEGDALRELGRQRHQLLAATARQARALARELGRPVSEAVAEEVQQTLSAALADPAAADAVRSATLTSALHYAGLGEVDLDGAVAVPGARTSAVAAVPTGADAAASGPASLDEARERKRAEQAEQAGQRVLRRLEQALEEADRDVQEAGEGLARAEEDLRTAGLRRAEASRRQVAVKRRIEELQARLHAAEAEAVAATHELRRLEHEHQAAERSAALARRMTDRARARRERTAGELAEHGR